MEDIKGNGLNLESGGIGFEKIMDVLTSTESSKPTIIIIDLYQLPEQHPVKAEPL